MQIFVAFFFFYKSIMNFTKKIVTFEKEEQSETVTLTDRESQLKEVKEIKYEDKYKKEYITLEPRQLSTNEKENLKNNFVMETTPLGNVIFYYNNDKNGFVYYSDSTIPYRFLETVARKYIITFQCKDVGIYTDETDEIAEPAEIKDEITVDATISEIKPVINKKNVFAKLKHYNHPNSIPSSSMIAKKNTSNKITQSNKKVKENRNKYISEGKIINFSFIKKIDKKQIIKRLNMTFAEFKKMQQESKNKTSL